MYCRHYCVFFGRNISTNPNAPASDIRNALWCIQSSLKVQISLHATRKNTLAAQLSIAIFVHVWGEPRNEVKLPVQHTRKQLSLPYIWHKDAFKIWQDLEHHMVSLGMCFHAASIMNIILCTTSTNDFLYKELATACISQVPIKFPYSKY